MTTQRETLLLPIERNSPVIHYTVQTTKGNPTTKWALKWDGDTLIGAAFATMITKPADLPEYQYNPRVIEWRGWDQLRIPKNWNPPTMVWPEKESGMSTRAITVMPDGLLHIRDEDLDHLLATVQQAIADRDRERSPYRVSNEMLDNGYAFIEKHGSVEHFCSCWTLETATLICDLLNEHHRKENG